MITITPPLPLASIDPASPHLPANHTPGHLTPSPVVFQLEERDGVTVAVALQAAAFDDGNPVTYALQDVQILLLTHGDAHTLTGSLDLHDTHGDTLTVTVRDGQAEALWS
ncbi:hypothetical protein ETD86_37355 [Nonomuraea turkmeniaca]|uniref:Uncharacterized protein n=1 Tax=Nonomuraea turkmeniaca TaxID=103838 RepID=A0A5S4F516_9ACTN|nr:hypothetical protein [Nonomuraea turkmeniaca]TMR10986.1 hypothetical protein ETD86_37355 [Nonomuraea turkmeniaca]